MNKPQIFRSAMANPIFSSFGGTGKSGINMVSKSPFGKTWEQKSAVEAEADTIGASGPDPTVVEELAQIFSESGVEDDQENLNSAPVASSTPPFSDAGTFVQPSPNALCPSSPQHEESAPLNHDFVDEAEQVLDNYRKRLQMQMTQKLSNLRGLLTLGVQELEAQKAKAREIEDSNDRIRKKLKIAGIIQ